MSAVHSSLHAMGMEQYLLAFLFLASYALALSEFIGVRGRRFALLSASGAAIGFAALTDPWMHGVLVVAFALVAMGLFAGTVWALWAVFGWPHGGAAAAAEAAIAQSGDGTGSLRAAAAAVWRRPRALARAHDTRR